MSEMQQFYKDKIMLLTGGSGFLGKVIIEKLLRTTEVKRIYVLLRAKRGQEIQERFVSWESDPVFDILLRTQPKAMQRVTPIRADCQSSDLGLSAADRRLLIEEVQLVLHGAATVRFTEPLHIALAINTRAARLLLQLAKQMQRLEAFVHVSTAYSNCLIDNMAPALMGRYPNTYTYTKALAEQVMQREAGDVPVGIFRPGVIIASYKEPMPGWIDNLYGPIAVLYGVAFGVLRITRLNVKAQAGIVPVDYSACMALATVWHTAIEAKPQGDPAIYNFTPSEENLITWGDFRDKAENLVHSYPLSKMMWCPFLHCTTTPWLFRLVAYFYHLLPGYAIDVVLRLRGQKPRMIKLYGKIHKNINILAPFVDTTWKFDTTNTQRLWQRMSSLDHSLFDFDMRGINWDDYFLHALSGIRIYLGKEQPTTIGRGKQILWRFQVLHRILQLTLCSVAAALLWSLLKLLAA
ncbi:fatty acyl-CoA reductase wat isoform X3 [Drosophila subobscura]|uniref:fatty acyl-CoA reductase wat isoform X3 n=1 Tax=Drosophila subobscura TaxID=7241 RepID=UPI00155AC4F9|nr:fatty acyl-CoA reductase wat isoform X3 [Drosophila subobscura]